MGAPDQERNWILASRNGDPAAIEALITTHQRMVHALTFRMTGSLADADDLAQETFIQAFQQIGQFRGESAFGSWVYRIAMNKCLNWRKREHRRSEIHQQWSRNDNLEPAAPPNDGPSQQVQEALMRLHPKQRAAIVLTVFEERTHAEAARLLGCSETTVSWRVFAAKHKLRKWLAPAEPEIRKTTYG